MKAKGNKMNERGDSCKAESTKGTMNNDVKENMRMKRDEKGNRR